MPIVLSPSDDKKSSGILVEVEHLDFAGGEYRDMTGHLERVRGLYDKALMLANDCALKINEQINLLAPEAQPSEYTIQFGIKMDAEIGAFIAKSTASAQLQVTLKWISK